MAKAELNENTTHEELMAFVDEIHAERTAYTEPPPAKDAKSDAQIVSEHAAAAEPKTPVAPQAKAPKGDETAEAPKKGKGETTDDRSWLDDDLRKEASDYGFDEEELAEFGSRDDVERVMRLLDKRLANAGRKALAEDESTGPDRDAQGRFTKTETTKEPETAKAPAAAAEPAAKPSYEIKLSKDKYEEDLVDELTGMRDHYESELAALRAKFEEAEAQQECDRFDAAVDELDLPKLFGTTGSESKEELQRRADLITECRALRAGLQQTTGKAPALESLVLRMARGAYPEEFDKHIIKKHTIKIAKQADKRQGGSVTRPGDVPESGREWAARRFRELSGA